MSGLRVRASQQTIVFAIFVLMFIGFAVALPGFRTADNMLGLLQNVALPATIMTASAHSPILDARR